MGSPGMTDCRGPAAEGAVAANEPSPRGVAPPALSRSVWLCLRFRAWHLGPSIHPMDKTLGVGWDNNLTQNDRQLSRCGKIKANSLWCGASGADSEVGSRADGFSRHSIHMIHLRERSKVNRATQTWLV